MAKVFVERADQVFSKMKEKQHKEELQQNLKLVKILTEQEKKIKEAEKLKHEEIERLNSVNRSNKEIS